METPTPGSIWRHYKSTGGSDYTYEIIGTAAHSETEELLIVYKPLYYIDPTSWKNGWHGLAVRPLSLWYDTVEYNGKISQRFIEVTQD